MSYKSFVKDLRSGDMTRRQALSGLAAAGIVALPLRPARAAVNVSVLSWAGYDDKSLHPKFFEKHGASPAFSFMGSSSRMAGLSTRSYPWPWA